jgi:lipopolysaccharide transport system permease protein
MQRTHIKANQPWWTVNWRELAEYRDLLWFLVCRDFTTIYKQSILGPLWFVLQPLSTTLVFTVVFGNIAKIGTDEVPPFLFYSSGMVLWYYFQGCLNDVSATFVGNAHLFGKVYFPRLIVPIALVIKNVGQLVLNFAVFLGFFAYYAWRGAPIHPTAWLALLPALVIQCAMAGMGAGLWLAALTAKYRDLRFALTFLATLWMYATPIAYSATKVSDSWRWILLANPMASATVFFRLAFLGAGSADLTLLFSGMAISVVLFVTGLMAFNRVQRTFIDIV